MLILFADSKNRHLRGEIKLAKLACSGCLAPCFVDSDCLTAASLIALCMPLMRYPLGHGLLCTVRMYELHPETGGDPAASPLCLLGQP